MSNQEQMNNDSTATVIKSKKGRWWKILLIALASMFVLWGILTIIGAIGVAQNTKKILQYETVQIENQLIPVKDADGYWTFTTDNEFKILLFSDTHLGGGFLSIKKDLMALNAIASMITAEKPDLVVFDGDITFPVPYSGGTNNNKRPTKMFIAMMEKLGVYYTVCYGNHDSEAYSTHTGDQIAELYSDEDLKYCLFQKGTVDGNGNSIIKVKNSSGIVTQAIVTIDSHSYTDGDFLGIAWKYDNIHQNQLTWYETEINRITTQNKAIDSTQGTVKSLAFFHIPLEEFRTAYNEYLTAGEQNTPNTIYNYGVVGEKEPYIYCGLHPDEVFETFLRVGSTQGIFNGHDHDNNISLTYTGIRMSYTYSIDYLAYAGISGRGYQRGCTVITVNPDGSFDCQLENYYQNKYQPLYPKETVTMTKD